MHAVKFDNLDSGRTFFWDGIDELIMGRGDQFGCHDKRISRRHASFKLLHDAIIMTSLNKNPCFYMKGGKPPLIVVKNEKRIVVYDGDCIGLIPKGSWFKISLTNSHPPSPISSIAVNDRNKTSPSVKKEQCADTTVDSDDMRSAAADDATDAVSRPATPPTPDNVQPVDTQSPTNVTPFCDNVDNIRQVQDSCKNAEKSASPFKVRQLPSWMMDDGPSAKKYAIPSANCSPENVNNRKSLEIFSEDINEELDRTTDALESPSNVNRAENPTLALINSSEDAPLAEREAAKSPPIDEIESPKSPPSAETESRAGLVTNQSVHSANDASVDVDVKFPVASSSNIEDSSLNNRTAASGSEKPSSSTEETEPLVTVKKEDTLGNAPAAPQPPARPSRPLCQYEGACYRRNEEHRERFSHPSDVDWITAEMRPMCRYDPNCYQTSKAHRVNVRHTCQPQRRPQQPLPGQLPLGNLAAVGVALRFGDALGLMRYHARAPDTPPISDDDLDMDEMEDSDDPYHTDGDDDDDDFNLDYDD